MNLTNSKNDSSSIGRSGSLEEGGAMSKQPSLSVRHEIASGAISSRVKLKQHLQTLDLNQFNTISDQKEVNDSESVDEK